MPAPIIAPLSSCHSRPRPAARARKARVTIVNFRRESANYGTAARAGSLPLLRPIALRKRRLPHRGDKMSDRDETYSRIQGLIDPFNKKGVEVSEATRFAQDLEWDSLTVMDFVASVEDEFDILISMNRAAEIESVGQLVEAVGQLQADK
jgi:acyl carrier protein